MKIPTALVFSLTLTVFVSAKLPLSMAQPNRVSAIEDSAPDRAVTLEMFLERSDLWSFHVWVDPEKVARELRHASRFPAVLLRVEQGAALVDFGRNGIHTIPISATNLLEEAGRIARGETDPELPNFIRYTANIFSRIKENGLRTPYLVDEYSSTPTFVLVYGDERLVEIDVLRMATHDLLQAVAKSGGLGIVVPTEQKFYAAAAKAGIDWVLPGAHPREPLIETLQHHPEKNALTVVRIDAYGKLQQRIAFPYPDAIPGLKHLQHEIHPALD